MRAQDFFHYPNVGPGTYGPFELVGGIYQVSAVGFSAGSAQLQQLGPDVETWLNVSNAISANGGDTIYLPPGQFQWVVSTDSGISVAVVRVPIE